ncbi:hypothetical protein D9619_000998 [Psilocybe cf. subviscida]|uniref:CcmS related domain-containing protein n=1 Tax=Psilocybe cf. subviscida TaxID=2480587 RepID=A0A8H5BDE7_9AGAR|nr:hypothetical protein D9619_000998 [Psilocybe cf. subviscida]
MAKNKKTKGKGDERPEPPPKSPPAHNPSSPPPAINIESEIPHRTSPEGQAQPWGTTPGPVGGWPTGAGAEWGADTNAHHGDDAAFWSPTAQGPQENVHNWSEPPNSLLHPPPNQQPSHLETIPERYTETDLSEDQYSGSFSDDGSYTRHEGEGQYGQPYSPQGMTAAQDHSAMRSPALTGQPALDRPAPAVAKDSMQTQKFSSASEAARKLEESRRGVHQTQPTNITPADHHAALRAHQLGTGGLTPMSSASAAAALHESTTNRNRAQKPPPPPPAKPPPQPANPPLPGKTAWTYPKPFTPNGHRAAPIAPDPSWIMTGGNAWSNKHRATKSTSAAGPGTGPAWPQPQPQQDMRGGWHQVDPRNPHQKIPAAQFHGVHSPQHQKHQSYPGHPMQQQPVHHNESEHWQSWGKEQRKQGGGGKGQFESAEQAAWGGGGTWDGEEGEYDEWNQQKAHSAAGGGGWDDGGAWGMGQGRGQGMGHAQGQGLGHGHGQAQAHGNAQQAHDLVAQMKIRQMLAQQMNAQGGRGQSKEKVNDAAGQWGQGGDWSQAGGAGDWGQEGGGGGAAWGGGKADEWGAKGDGWAAKGDGWAAKGDGWAAKGESWGAKGDEWGASKADNWGGGGGGEWNSPMHAGASTDWSQHKPPSHAGRDAAGTRNVVSPQARSQILNSLLNNSALNQGQPKNNSSMTTKQHQMNQQQAAMLQAQLAAVAAAAGGNPKVHQKTKMQQSVKANVWEADDGWGEVDSDDEEYGNRRVHFSPKESEVWGASPRSIPSKSLAAAAARQGIATTPLNLSSNVKFVESSGAAFSFVSEAFFGNTRLARERIHWLFPVDKDPRVAAMHQWVKKMSYNLGTFGLIKFLESRERGVLFVNVVFRMEDHPKEPAFDWLTFPHIQGTMDKTLQESAAFYDPTRVVMVILYLPSQSGRSVAAWRMKIDVPDDARAKYKEYIAPITKMLREPKDYVVMLDEAPKPPPKAPTKSQLRKSRTITKGGKAVTVKSSNKVLPNGQIQHGKKKRKWWKFFLS